jgi:carbon monoxide dehydrogenase subunit G
MSLDIEEQLELAAPVERVWKFLIDPRRVVTCLPGAALDEVVDERTFLGNMKVKVGPVTVTYKGRAKLVEVDDAAHRVAMSGEGTEQGGAGSAKMTMQSVVEDLGGGKSRVIVKAQVDLVGRLVQFGRGMIKGVAQQLFKQFAASVRAELEREEPAEPPPPEPTPVEPPPPTPAAAEPAAPVVRALERPTAPATPSAKIGLPPRKVEPIRALPLLFRALWDAIVGALRRLFRRARA